jgi:hypothetical protein
MENLSKLFQRRNDSATKLTFPFFFAITIHHKSLKCLFLFIFFLTGFIYLMFQEDRCQTLYSFTILGFLNSLLEKNSALLRCFPVIHEKIGCNSPVFPNASSRSDTSSFQNIMSPVTFFFTFFMLEIFFPFLLTYFLLLC